MFCLFVYGNIVVKMDNEIYKQHDFIFLTCMCAFCNAFGNNDTSQKICMYTNCLISSFVRIPYIGAYFIHKSCSFPWFWNSMMKKNLKYTKKDNDLLQWVCENKMFDDRNILHMW
jgi:hypothetical protein